jgi:hypothetical protein
MPALKECQWHFLVRSKHERVAEDRRSAEIPERIGISGSMPEIPQLRQSPNEAQFFKIKKFI